MKVFIDTSAYIALFIASEIHHQKVKRCYQHYRKQRALFFTSDYILDELFTRLLYDFGKHATTRVINLLNKSVANEEIKLFQVDQTVFQKAITLMLKYADQKISFTDATSIVLYKTFAVDEMFTLDSDFKKVGLKVQPSQ